jgi:serine/threonine-protein kinase
VDSKRWRELKALFQEALELEGAARAAFLDRLGARDRDARCEVESLLASSEVTESPLDRRPVELASELLESAARGEGMTGVVSDGSHSSMLGRRLGPYKIVRRLGRGGLGSVYLANREEEFTKQVAIKVIRRTVATAELLRRFEFERQILATIEHPNIARLLDGGTTEDGLPFLVMEYIDGEPVDQYCDRRKLPVVQRLELFLTICEAVSTAHRKLVVHCDIKPDNVLVTSEAVPKLVDFGIARILGPEAVIESADEGDTGLRMLTPDYASPEQLRGEALTTGSDVYSLGVLLYELLTGSRPHTVGQLSLDEAARLVSETGPRRPSTVPGSAALRRTAAGRDTAEIEKAAANRSTTPSRLERQLAGDLDSIVLEALSPDPEDRYPAVERLADDIRRFLGGYPVAARAAGVWYRGARFVQRHRLSVAAVTLALGALMTLVAMLSLQSARLAALRDRAEDEATSARVVSAFLQDMLTTADPFEGIGGDATVLEALDRAVSEIEMAFAEEPALEAAVRDAAGTTYLRLGQLADAEPQLARALELRRALGSEHRLDLARSLNSVGRLEQERGDYEAAEGRYREALAIAEASSPPDVSLTAETIAVLGTVRHDRGDLLEAEELYRRALAGRRSLSGKDADLASSLDDLAGLLQERGELDAAEEMLRESLSIRRRVFEPSHPDISSNLNNLASVLHDKGMLEEAEDLYRVSLRMARDRFSGDHLQVATAINNLATLLHDKEKLDEAGFLYRESLDMTRRVLGDEHPEVAVSMANLAGLLHDEGMLEEAESRYRESIAMARRFLGEDHSRVADSLQDLALVIEDRGDLVAAEGALEEALEINRRAARGDPERIAFNLADLASVVCARGEADRARPYFDEASRLLTAAGSEADVVAEITEDFAACAGSR